MSLSGHGCAYDSILLLAALKILLGSHFFFPSTGGIETATDLLAREFVALGHDVRVITQSAGDGDFPFEVIRRPGLGQLLRQVKWCEVFLQNNISLQTLWPLFIVRRPFFITHQTWISPGWTRPFKRAALRLATNFSISHAMAARLPRPSIQVGNPYDDHIFREVNGSQRTRDLIFVGRLVSDKGANVLLDALAVLRQSGLAPSTSVVGEGPERESLEHKTKELGLGESVAFMGSRNSKELCDILNQHRPGRAFAVARAIRDCGSGRDCLWMRRGGIGGRRLARSHRSVRRHFSQWQCGCAGRCSSAAFD